MSEIARFYGFTVLMDDRFEGSPNILINYEEDNIKARYDLEKEKFTDGDFSQCMLRVIKEWIADHIQTLRAMWSEKQITVLPDWE